MRSRFQSLLAACGIVSVPRDLQRGLDLGSLRAGGASWLLLVSEDSELVRRRGRWINSKVMEIYVQEVGSLQFLPRLDKKIRERIFQGVTLFPWCLEYASKLYNAGVPETIWFLLFKSEASQVQPVGEVQLGKDGCMQLKAAARMNPVPTPSCKREKKAELELLYNRKSWSQVCKVGVVDIDIDIDLLVPKL